MYSAAGKVALTAPIPWPALQTSRQALGCPPPETLTPEPFGFDNVSGSRPFSRIEGSRKHALAPVKPLMTTMSLDAESTTILLKPSGVFASAQARKGEPT